MPWHSGTRRPYQPLLDYLAALPPGQQAVTLRFVELDALIGARLSVSARTDGSYWNGSGTARRNWLATGRAAHLNRLDRTVTFTQSPP